MGGSCTRASLILVCLSLYISCGCLTRWLNSKCLNSKRSSSTRGNTTKKTFPTVQGVCNCTYSAREDYFSDNEAKELGLVVQISLWVTSGVCSSESSLGHSKEQLLLLLLLPSQDSGLVSGPELAVETSSRTLNTSLVVIFLRL